MGASNLNGRDPSVVQRAGTHFSRRSGGEHAAIRQFGRHYIDNVFSGTANAREPNRTSDVLFSRGSNLVGTTRHHGLTVKACSVHYEKYFVLEQQPSTFVQAFSYVAGMHWRPTFWLSDLRNATHNNHGNNVMHIDDFIHVYNIITIKVTSSARRRRKQAVDRTFEFRLGFLRVSHARVETEQWICKCRPKPEHEQQYTFLPAG